MASRHNLTSMNCIRQLLWSLHVVFSLFLSIEIIAGSICERVPTSSVVAVLLLSRSVLFNCSQRGYNR